VSKHYYAEQSPRGFANETMVHRFPSRAARDAWVEEHRYDGDINSAYTGASACTADEARRILAYRGDAITESYNGLVDHDEADDLRELMARWDEYRAKWIETYGTEEGFSEWFTQQATGAKT